MIILLLIYNQVQVHGLTGWAHGTERGIKRAKSYNKVYSMHM